ncbi:MAG: branched-chain amino acid ABC transporter permease [Candidimonas sp.]|nr:MAG: branched-chain amino acid ABC transporter permease [Candidimonas sp.]
MLAFLAKLVIDGLILGSIYALVAVGLALIFGVLEIVNFANGELYMLGAYATYLIMSWLGADYWVAAAGGVAVVALVGVFLYDTVLKSVGPRDFEKGILITIGISMVMQNGAISLFSAEPRLLNNQLNFASLHILGAVLPGVRLLPVVVAVVAFTLLYWYLKHTRQGKAMRAISQNREAAAVVGIRATKTGRLALFVGAGLCGLAGAALAPLYAIDPLMGLPMLFKAFAIIIIGGLGSIPGAAIAALLIGVMESIAGGLGSSVLQDSVAFIFMIVVLLFYPYGLFGRRMRV